MPLSLVIAVSYLGGTLTGTISAVRRPSAVPLAAFMCEARASASCSSRETPLSFAIFSADCPMDSPVVGSAIAGVMGMKSLARIVEKACTRWPIVFALLAATSASEKPREWRIGTLESDSAPPAMATVAWPSAIWSAALVIA